MAVTQRNADGLEAIYFTEEQRYLFDTRGWLAFPGVLEPEEAREMREFCVRLRNERESIPEKHRSSIGGPLERLTDHPLLLGMNPRYVSLIAQSVGLLTIRRAPVTLSKHPLMTAN